jgi:methoxymalonate biosynthesis acyl carrier protein
MNSDEATVKQSIRDFLLRSINVRELKDHENLFETGIVNSLFAVQLMTFIEKTFAIEMETDDLDIENFKSLDAMTAFVLQKNGHRHAAAIN